MHPQKPGTMPSVKPVEKLSEVEKSLEGDVPYAPKNILVTGGAGFM